MNISTSPSTNAVSSSVIQHLCVCKLFDSYKHPKTGKWTYGLSAYLSKLLCLFFSPEDWKPCETKGMKEYCWKPCGAKSMQRPVFTSAEQTQMGTECATVILGLVGKKKIKYLHQTREQIAVLTLINFCCSFAEGNHDCINWRRWRYILIW